MNRNQDHFRGCMLGGAIGDALGWPVEFLKLSHIKKKYGNQGIRDLEKGSAGKAEITDDTQMSLFTAEGILCSGPGQNKKEKLKPQNTVYQAYQRWLMTQGYTPPCTCSTPPGSWLIKEKKLHKKRAPGSTCIRALLQGRKGTISNPINDSKGCGGLMRVAPAGLFYPKQTAFKRAAEFAAITHGHPAGYLAAGTLAYMIASIIEGKDIAIAAKDACMHLKEHENHQACTDTLDKSFQMLHKKISDMEAIARLGHGWIAEEALGISIYCALKYRDNFRQALIAAVNHDGDSDSTGAITGNILGAFQGLSKIPRPWIEKIELREVLFRMADDLLTECQKPDNRSAR